MVYMGGDNSLSEAGERDLDEMRQVGSTPEVNIAVQFDRVGDGLETKRYFIQREGLDERVESLGETDSGEPQLLLDFVDWATREYPAERYALIYWGHGAGWSPNDIDEIAVSVGSRGYSMRESAQHAASPLGRVLLRPTIERMLDLEETKERAICSDNASGPILDTIGFGRLLAQACDRIGQPFDLLGSDSGLVNSLELAYEARPYVRLLVASEDFVPADGWPYHLVLEKLVAEPELASSAFSRTTLSKISRSLKYSVIGIAEWQQRPGIPSSLHPMMQ